MEYTINKDGNKIADKLDIAESYDVFYLAGRNEPIDIGTADTYEEAEKLRDNSKYPNESIWIWDNRTNN